MGRAAARSGLEHFPDRRFDLHGRVAFGAADRTRLEELVRYCARPPIAYDRLSKQPDGRYLLRLKAPWRDGTTHLLFEPIELMPRTDMATARHANAAGTHFTPYRRRGRALAGRRTGMGRHAACSGLIGVTEMHRTRPPSGSACANRRTRCRTKAETMKTTPYYMLLSSIASSALAACGDSSSEGDECPHVVVVKSKKRTITGEEACSGIYVSRESGALVPSYSVKPASCTELCDDPALNTCALAADYLESFAQLNGPAYEFDGGGFSCPASGKTDLTCSREEARGRLHDGCPIAGRRPQGLVMSQRRAQQEAADYLARSAHLEAASVLAFEALAQDVSRLGAPPRLVADCLRAARQELQHARVVRELSRARGAEPAKVRVREHALPSLLELALQNMIEGVVRESYGALQAIVSGRAAAAEDVRRALASIAADEAEHAALSLRIAAWLHTQLSAEERLQVSRARHAAIAELRCEVDHEPAPALHSELGVPSRTLALRLVDELARHLEGSSPEAVALS